MSLDRRSIADRILDLNSERLSRREMLRRAGLLGLSLPVVAGLLAACGEDDDDEPAPPAVDPDDDADDEEPDEEPVDDDDEEPVDTDDDTPADPADREVTFIETIDIDTLDPHMNWSVAGRNTYYQLFGTLCLGDSELNLRADLAESWEVVTDTSVQFNLREGVTFHNGEEFNAETVRFTYERLLDEEQGAPWRVLMLTIDHVEVVDDLTVIIHATRPYAPFIADIGRMAQVPPGYVEEVGNEHFAENPVGTGPFQFVEWVRGERVVLEAFDDYWDGRPEVERLVIRAVPEPLTRITELVTGRADLVVRVPPELIPEIENSDIARIESVASAQNVYVGMDTREPPFDDVRVRQAMNYAVNVDALVEFIMGGLARPVSGPFSPLIWGADREFEAYGYDPDRAMELLEEAGYGDGFDVDLLFGEGRVPKGNEVAEAIAAELERVGVNVQVVRQEAGVHDDMWRTGELHGMYLSALTATIGDPDQILRFIDGAREGRYFNHPELDELIASGAETLDPDQRESIIREIQQLASDEAPWIFLFDVDLVYGVSNRINYQPFANELIWAHGITFR